MNKENKVTSLKLSKKIHDKAKEKGFELPKSEWWWEKDTQCDMARFDGGYDIIHYEPSFGGFRAYDIAELGEMLNKIKIDICEKPFLRYSIDRPAKHNYEIIDGEKHYTYKNISDDNLVEAMGKMFYYLLKNDLL